MDKLKVPTKIMTFEDTAKALQSVEKSFNILLDKVNTVAEHEVKETEGETGDIQITQNKDKSYTFLVKTGEGWKTPVIGESAIKFKDKPASIAIEKKESIDEIEATDITTGDTKREQTIFDEKNNKFIMPKYDWVSDWTNWPAEDAGLIIPHTLTGVTGDNANIWYIIYVRNALNSGTATRWKIFGADGAMKSAGNDNSPFSFDADNFYMWHDSDEGDSYIFFGANADNDDTIRVVHDSCSFRILAWHI